MLGGRVLVDGCWVDGRVLGGRVLDVGCWVGGCWVDSVTWCGWFFQLSSLGSFFLFPSYSFRTVFVSGSLVLWSLSREFSDLSFSL